MKSLSFDNMVRLYDETRIFDEECFESALDYMVERFPPRAFPNVLEPGIGTGRIAIPLAERGYRVTGVDISEEMLAFLTWPSPPTFSTS
jgi:predicted TPR repeat methyltransferase